MAAIVHFFKKISNHELIIGSVLFVLSILLMILFVDHYNFVTVLPLGVGWIGTALIVDSFNVRYNNKSYFPNTPKNEKRFYKLFIVSFIFSLVLLDGFGCFFSRLWYFPYFPFFPVYIMLMPTAYFFYSFILFSLYELVKDFINRYRGAVAGAIRKKIYICLIKIQFLIGIAGVLISVAYVARLVRLFELPIFEIRRSSNISVDWWLMFLVLISCYFIFEYIAYRQNKQTLTSDLVRGNFLPLLSILIANFVAIILIEFSNSPFQVWVFDNWAYNDIRLLNVPLIALLAWPLQFLALLSMLRVVFDKSKEEIW